MCLWVVAGALHLNEIHQSIAVRGALTEGKEGGERGKTCCGSKQEREGLSHLLGGPERCVRLGQVHPDWPLY